MKKINVLSDIKPILNNDAFTDRNKMNKSLSDSYVRDINGVQFSLEGVTFEDAESINANCRNYLDKEDLMVCLQQNGVSNFINPPLILDPTRNDRAGTPLYVGLTPTVVPPQYYSPQTNSANSCDPMGGMMAGVLFGVIVYYVLSKTR